MSACLPGSSDPIRSPIPTASAPADVSRASPSLAVIDVGSVDRSRSRPTNSAAARSASTASDAFSASQPRASRPPRRQNSRCRPPAVIPWASRRYAHGQQAIAAPERSTTPSSSSSTCTAWARSDVRAEHAEAVEVDQRRGARAGEVRLPVAAVGRDVEREPRPPPAGQLARAGDELVAHQVVPDQRHPRLDQPAGRKPVDERLGGGQHVAGRRGERSLADVPPPPADRASRADRGERGGDPVGMLDRPGLDRGRDAVADRLDQRQRGAQLVVVGGVGGVHRHGPPEDALVAPDVVGDARAHEPVAGQVLVGVDVAGRRERVRTAEHGDVGVAPWRRRRTARARRSPPRRRRSPVSPSTSRPAFIVSTVPARTIRSGSLWPFGSVTW